MFVKDTKGRIKSTADAREFCDQIFNPFFPMFSFDPLDNIIKPKVLWCFSGGSKKNIGKKSVTNTSGKKLLKIPTEFPMFYCCSYGLPIMRPYHTFLKRSMKQFSITVSNVDSLKIYIIICHRNCLFDNTSCFVICTCHAYFKFIFARVATSSWVATTSV